MICPFLTEPKFFLFNSDVVDPLIYYSHVPAFVVSVLLGVIVFRRNKTLAGRSLTVLTMLLATWLFFNLVLWTNTNSNIIIFFWSLIDSVFALIPIALYFFVYSNFYGTLPERWKVGLLALIALPILIFSSSELNLYLFNLDGNVCQPGAGQRIWYINYLYITSALIALLIFIEGVYIFLKMRYSRSREIFVILGGSLFFLVSFFVAGFLASYLYDQGIVQTFSIEQYGIFGMVIFLSAISYSMVKFKSLKTNLVSTTVLVVAQGLIVASLLFIRELSLIYVVISSSLILYCLLGYITIKGVHREIKQREQIEHLATQLRTANETLAKTNIRLKEIDTQKSEFMSFATHQLRSPLTAMKGYSSLILDGDYGEVSADVRDAVNKIHDSANTLTNVVNDYLNTSRIELGGMQYVMRVTDLRGIVHELVEAMRPTYEAAGVTVSFHADAHSKYLVNVDTDKIRQVISNIIDNSIKYTPQGVVTVTLSKDLTHNKIMLEVKDNGIGISKEVISKLFSKFTRADNASKVNIRGTGLGLYLAKQLIEAMHGEISAESAGEGKGSRFCLVLPAEPIMKR
jgi:signal transduction histidine kinase